MLSWLLLMSDKPLKLISLYCTRQSSLCKFDFALNMDYVINISLIFAEFSWDDVKVDKHRENYLGHSIKAPVGRWQKGIIVYLNLYLYRQQRKSH